MLRVAVVGAGAHSRRHHGPALQRLASEPSGADLVAVCDRDREAARRYAAEYGFASSTDDIDDLLAGTALDALVVVTPPAVTTSLVADLLPRGLPLLVEKPPGETVEEATRLRDAAERHDVAHMMSFNRRFHPAVRRAREWIEENAGHRPPQHAVARLYRHDRPDSEFLTHTGIHAVDAVSSVMGRVETMSRTTSPDHTAGSPCAGTAAFEAGGTASFVLAPDAGCDVETYEFVGPRYAVRADTLNDRLRIRDGGEPVASWEPATRLPTFVRSGALAETRAFLAAVRGERAFSPTLADGRHAMAVAETLDDRRE
ncbi:Gfo/Idh/MocA family protein [Halomarina oriensis]|uniref:Gfo/Idh/MocA-like oxidoreductase N-terminal domain-containing protein n=1 Tax=Halomarina oriensis TaxID=671145 RepID=A0A6B0GKB6_9EURY|nr:Gfo/Idh/MocA family oxidoreductase [Halomarina oriensis]MWG33859.1 hypothetical protein [Halomarina oriensis]